MLPYNVIFRVHEPLSLSLLIICTLFSQKKPHKILVLSSLSSDGGNLEICRLKHLEIGSCKFVIPKFQVIF